MGVGGKCDLLLSVARIQFSQHIIMPIPYSKTITQTHFQIGGGVGRRSYDTNHKLFFVCL